MESASYLGLYDESQISTAREKSGGTERRKRAFSSKVFAGVESWHRFMFDLAPRSQCCQMNY